MIRGLDNASESGKQKPLEVSIYNRYEVGLVHYFNKDTLLIRAGHLQSTSDDKGVNYNSNR